MSLIYVSFRIGVTEAGHLSKSAFNSQYTGIYGLFARSIPPGISILTCPLVDCCVWHLRCCGQFDRIHVWDESGEPLRGGESRVAVCGYSHWRDYSLRNTADVCAAEKVGCCPLRIIILYARFIIDYTVLVSGVNSYCDS